MATVASKAKALVDTVNQEAAQLGFFWGRQNGRYSGIPQLVSSVFKFMKKSASNTWLYAKELVRAVSDLFSILLLAPSAFCYQLEPGY